MTAIADKGVQMFKRSETVRLWPGRSLMVIYQADFAFQFFRHLW